MKKSAKKFSLAMLLLAVVLLLSSCIPLAVALNLDNTVFESSSRDVRLHFYTDSQLGAYKLGVRIGSDEDTTHYCWMVDVDENHVFLYKDGYGSEYKIADLDPDSTNPSQLQGYVNFKRGTGIYNTETYFTFNKVD